MNITELQPGIVYDIENNPYPHHIMYYIDENGILHHKDLLMHCSGKATERYNEVITWKFMEYRPS